MLLTLPFSPLAAFYAAAAAWLMQRTKILRQLAKAQGGEAKAEVKAEL